MKIVAFIDASLYARSVIDHTAWLARNRPASIELVQIVSPNELMAEQVTTVGPSASIALDHERVEAKVGELERAGRCQLDAARNRLAAAGLPDVTARLIHGNIAASMLEVTRSASIAVMGKRGENADLARLSLGSQVERLVRSAPIPVLAVSRSFRPIERMLLAMNAGDTLAVDALAAGALPPADLQLLHVGDASGTIKATLQQAASDLSTAGFAVSTQVIQGDPRLAIPEHVVLQRFDLLAMGSFRSSRLKSLILGSLTSDLVRACQVPILLC